MADKYRRIEKAQDSLPNNEIRVKRKVGIGRYLKRAYDLLTDKENANPTIIIKGVSNAVESAVKLAELIKHRVKGLHQLNKISNITIDDEYEPLEEGLDHLKFTRIVTMLEIKLSLIAPDKKDLGYQPPIDESEVQEYSERVDGARSQNGEGETRKRNNNNRNRRGRARGGAPRTEGGENRAQTAGNQEKSEGQRGGRRGGRNNRARGGRDQGENQVQTTTPGGEDRPQRARGGRGGRGRGGNQQPRTQGDGENTYGKNRVENEDKPKFEVIPGKDPQQFGGGQATRRPRGDGEQRPQTARDGNDQRPPRTRGQGQRDFPPRDDNRPYERRQNDQRYPPREPRRGGDNYQQHNREPRQDRPDRPRGEYRGGENRGYRGNRGGQNRGGNRGGRFEGPRAE